jgi:hypothetical protein
MITKPHKEHDWLQQLVGEWTYEGEADMGPDKPPEKFRGTESVRSIGGLWTVAEGRGEMPDGEMATMFMTLGYDPQRMRYVGTWFGSMMTHLWIYDGEMDASQRVLTLNAVGPDMTVEGRTAKYRDVIEWKSNDLRLLTSHVLGDDGTWHPFMRASYRRKT